MNRTANGLGALATQEGPLAQRDPIAITPQDLPAEEASPSRPDRLARWVLTMPLLSVTILAKFAFHVGATEILIAVPLILMALVVGLASKRLQFEGGPLVLYVLLMSFLVCTQALNGSTFSFGSLALLLVMHLGYTVTVRPGMLGATAARDFFRGLSLLIAVLSILQFVLQFSLGPTLAFPIEHFVPDALVTQYYNYFNPLGYGSEIYKANGVFLLEPSMLSQLLALAILYEMICYHSTMRMLVLGAALLLSYSGTGIIMLLATLPVLVILHRRFKLVAFVAIVMTAVIAFGDKLNLDVFARRATEFTEPGSSGFFRFVSGFYLFNQALWNDPVKALFGMGAGTFFDYRESMIYDAAEMSWVKIMFEFGILGSLAYWGFLYTCLLRSTIPGLIKLALIVMTLLNGIFDPWSHGVILSLAIWPSTRKPKTAPAPFGSASREPVMARS